MCRKLRAAGVVGYEASRKETATIPNLLYGEYAGLRLSASAPLESWGLVDASPNYIEIYNTILMHEMWND